MGAIPHECMDCYILYLKHKNDMYACPPVALEKL